MEYSFRKFLFKIFFLFFFISANLFAQNVNKGIDSLLIIENERIRNQISSERLIDWNKKIALKCINEKYTKGEVLAYANIANSLWVTQKYKESLYYLQKAEKKSDNINDTYVKGKIYIEYAQTYHYMGLSGIANKYCETSLNYFLRMPPNMKRKRALTYAYGCNAIYLYSLKKNELALESLKNAVKIIPNPLDVSNIGYHYTYIEFNKDSANFYFKKAFRLLEQPKFKINHYQFASVLIEYANFKQKENKPIEALVELKKAMNYGRETNNKTLLLQIYISMSNAYKSIGDSKNEHKFLEKYYSLKDSIDTENKNGINVAVNELFDKRKKEKELITEKDKYLNFLILGIFIIVIGIIVLYFLYYKRKKELHNSSLEIIEYKEETDLLKRKMNESFIEIINMAKANHPNFYTRFLEIYPNFQKKLLCINPNLQNSELVLLAYIYLNFETKEIADYLFKSPKTIQNRKHNLRKKLQISSSEDIYVWLKNL